MCLLILEREEGEREGARERERNVRQKHLLFASRMFPDWGSKLQLKYVPDWKSNHQPFGVQEDAPIN